MKFLSGIFNVKPLIAEVGPLFRVFSPLKTVTYYNMLGKKCYLAQGGFCLFGFGDFVCLFVCLIQSCYVAGVGLSLEC